MWGALKLSKKKQKIIYIKIEVVINEEIMKNIRCFLKWDYVQ